MVILSFRYTIVSSLNTHPLEFEYHRAAKAVLDGSASRPGRVFQLLRDKIYVPDERFEQDFARLAFNASGPRNKLAKYILARLEHDLSGRDVNPETDTGTVEHILPQNPSAAWSESFPPERWESYSNRLGNLTLLEPELNRALGSNAYPEKREVYARSRYALTTAVAYSALEEWTPVHVDARARALASQAANIWRSDFA